MLHPHVDLISGAFFAIVGYHFHMIALTALRMLKAKVVAQVHVDSAIVSELWERAE